MADETVPRKLLDAVLEYGWHLKETGFLMGPFHPFGTCICGTGLWPVDEADLDGPKRCDDCGTEVKADG